MKQRQSLFALVLLVLALCIPALAQEKQLTIDDIFDPAKKVNFSGTPPNIRWLKDGTHYLLANDASKKNVPRLQKVNALTGEATPFSIPQRWRQHSRRSVGFPPRTQATGKSRLL